VKKFIGHEPCPHCGSKNNVGVWDNGQKYCFTPCGYYVSGSDGLNIDMIRERLSQQPKNKDKKDHVALPIDFSLILRHDAQEWIAKYGITEAERFRFKIGWSDLYESLILPSFDLSGNLVVCQRRYFGMGEFPKYHTKGRPESVIWTVRPSIADARPDPRDTYNGTIVIVEDVISAIKIGRRWEAMPLWGANLSDNKLVQIAKRWETIVLWLDFNKTAEAVKFRQKAAPYFNGAYVVSTEKDPKEYNEQQISEFLCLDDIPF
jgi:hypothetical protein